MPARKTTARKTTAKKKAVDVEKLQFVVAIGNDIEDATGAVVTGITAAEKWLDENGAEADLDGWGNSDRGHCWLVTDEGKLMCCELRTSGLKVELPYSYLSNA